MKRILITSLFALLGVIFLGGAFAFFSQSSAKKVAIEQWDYAAITSVYYFEPEREKINDIIGIVEFCEMTNTGCKRTEIRYELDYGKYLREARMPETFQARVLASRKAAEIAFQKALNQLGNSGWEMTSEPIMNFNPVNLYAYEKYDDKSLIFTRENTKSIYFKRLKNRIYNGKE